MINQPKNQQKSSQFFLGNGGFCRKRGVVLSGRFTPHSAHQVTQNSENVPKQNTEKYLRCGERKYDLLNRYGGVCYEKQ